MRYLTFLRKKSPTSKREDATAPVKVGDEFRLGAVYISLKQAMKKRAYEAAAFSGLFSIFNREKAVPFFLETAAIVKNILFHRPVSLFDRFWEH
jgi:hypothetical protein